MDEQAPWLQAAGHTRPEPLTVPADQLRWNGEGVTQLNAYQMTADPKYWDAFEKQAKFVEDKSLDREYGEWYTSIAADGRINTEKAGPWKAPYHVTRALLEVISRLGRTL